MKYLITGVAGLLGSRLAEETKKIPKPMVKIGKLPILNHIINSESLWRRDAIKLLSEYFLYRGEKLKSDEYKSLLNSVKTK